MNSPNVLLIGLWKARDCPIWIDEQAEKYLMECAASADPFGTRPEDAKVPISLGNFIGDAESLHKREIVLTASGSLRTDLVARCVKEMRNVYPRANRLRER